MNNLIPDNFIQCYRVDVEESGGNMVTYQNQFYNV